MTTTPPLPDRWVNQARLNALEAAKRAGKATPHEASKSLLAFTRHVFPELNENWHVRVLCDALDKWVEREIKNLIILLPPRHGKSTLVSEHLPAYVLGKYPDSRFMGASYTAGLASSFNRKVQRIIDNPRYAEVFPNTQLFGKNNRTNAQNAYLRNDTVFEIVNHKGSYRNAGVGGGLVGHGYDYGVVDDMVKSRAEAQSITYRNRSFDWLRGVFFTRRERNASTLITFTRWHKDDPIGRLLDLAAADPDAMQWTVIRFPAIAEEPLDPLDQRQIGEPLWEWKYNAASLNSDRVTYGELEWASQYQQRPMPMGAGLFDAVKINIVDAPPLCERRVRFYDLAVSEKTTADYTAGVLMGLTNDNTPVIYDVYRRQANPVATGEAIIQNALLDGKQVPIVLEAENSARVQLDYLLRDPRLHGYSMSLQSPEGDKTVRAIPIAARVNAGQVVMQSAVWNRTFLDELSLFPQVAHDDQTDALSGAWKYFDKQVTPDFFIL